jgi:hypothetical protein
MCLLYKVTLLAFDVNDIMKFLQPFRSVGINHSASTERMI